MNRLWKEFKTVFIAKDTRLLRKTYFYYFLVFFIVLIRIDLMTIHHLRLRYLMGLFKSIPRTQEIRSAVLFADYSTRLNPADVNGWVILAEGLCQIGDLPGAVQAYQKAIDLRPDDQEFRLALAKVYRQLHQEEKAEAVLKLPLQPLN